MNTEHPFSQELWEQTPGEVQDYMRALEARVVALPPVAPAVSEFQLHQLVCPRCGAMTKADLPTVALTGDCGLRVQAITALCTGTYHLPKRTAPR